MMRAGMESSVENTSSSIETYGRSGDRKLLGVVGMVSSLAAAVGLYAAVGFAQPVTGGGQQVRHTYPQGSVAASLESADGPGGAASLVRPRPAASFHGEG